MYRNEYILKRHAANPIITPKDIHWTHCDAVFNCGQTIFNGQVLLLISVCPAGELPTLHVAVSDDGINFKINEKPFFDRVDDEIWGPRDGWIIDPRITKIDDTYYIVRPMGDEVGPMGYLFKTKDWVTYEKMDAISLPPNRVPCLFPKKINGLYYRLDRPYNLSRGNMWVSASPDLLFWGKYKPLLNVPYSPVWASEKIGPTPPIWTPDGWVEIFHGMLTYAGGGRYSLGALLLDLDEPWKIIGETKGWILTPDAPYEFMGNCQNCIFACGAIGDLEKDTIKVYYGAADTCIGLAEGRLSELIDVMKKNRPESK